MNAAAPRPGAVVAALAFGGLGASLAMTIMLPIQADLPVLLNATRDDTAWVVTATLLASAVATPIAGKLGDMYGKRRVFLWLIALQILGSVIGGLSTHVVPLIVGRALQGVAIGVISVGISLMRDVLPARLLAPSIGFMSATIGLGGALGLPLAGFVTGYLDWHMLFWISAAVAALSFALVLWLVPARGMRTPGRLDWIGAAVLAAALSGILLGVSRGNEWGWASAPTLACFIAGAAVLAAWVWWELRTTNPITDIRTTIRPTVLMTNLASLILAFSLFGGNIVFPQLLELPADTGVGLGLPVAIAGLVLLPQSLAIMIVSPLSGRLVGIVGARALLTVAGAISFASFLVSWLVPLDVWGILIANAALGAGAGIGFSAMPTLIMQDVPASETGSANGVNSLMRALGNSCAAAILGAILANGATDVAGVPVPGMGAFHATFLVAAAAGLVATILSAVIPRPRPPFGEVEALPIATARTETT